MSSVYCGISLKKKKKQNKKGISLPKEGTEMIVSDDPL